MGFLKNFFTNVLHDEAPVIEGNSFEELTEDALEAHLEVAKYGDFTLTDAIRPSYDLKVVPSQGYRHDVYHDRESNSKLPVLMASASREKLFELFIELLEPLGNVVDIVLESSHTQQGNGHIDLYREHMDSPVLMSTLWDYEDILTNDGCCGIAVLNPQIPLEVQFDEHKLLIVYGEDLEPFESIFESYDLLCDDNMRFITEAEHVHSSSDAYAEKFEEMRMRLGMDNEDMEAEMT